MAAVGGGGGKDWRAGADKKAACGPKPWATEVMLRIMLLKRLHNLSDEQVEYQLRDRLSFLCFVQLGLGESVPDSRAIWLYADKLAKANGARELFEEFNRQLAERGLLVKEGVMVDATFVGDLANITLVKTTRKSSRARQLPSC